VTAADVRRYRCGALGEACAGGHLEVATLVADTFDLTSDDVRADHNRILNLAIEFGRLDTTKWLVERFKLTSADIDEAVQPCASLSAPLHDYLALARPVAKC
jgi:hypothetical protein